MRFLKHAWVGVALLGVAVLGGCMHVKGVALDDRTQKPAVDAELTVGRPDGIGVYQRYHVNEAGKFDFWMSMTDQEFLFIWDGHGDPQTAVQKIKPIQVNDHMTIYVHKGETIF